MQLVTRFSHEYDFRNKRLPVWRVDYGAPVKASLFVDTGTGVLVDRVADGEKPERLVFSFIHKWNFLVPVGRLAQNVIVGVFAIALIGFMAVLGLRRICSVAFGRGVRARGRTRTLAQRK